jgi:hypothetical protein
MTERCGTISAQWPPSIHDDVITTPYPKPLHEYELVSQELGPGQNGRMLTSTGTSLSGRRPIYLDTL